MLQLQWRAAKLEPKLALFLIAESAGVRGHHLLSGKSMGRNIAEPKTASASIWVTVVGGYDSLSRRAGTSSSVGALTTACIKCFTSPTR
ncbi:MAG: hypothetical protein JO033_19275 [Acidobacteriaceae bacterium]|nr:hypothetical protein [Acidobacteriaceae bacterium]MBV9501566.1 hypothetical protein [Acidobacteriaceae bacterium]